MEENDTRQSETNETVNPSSHTMDVLKAALPYIDTRTQRTMNIALKAMDFFSTIRQGPATAELSAASLENKSIDTEGMLTSIKGVCTKREQDMVDNILNFIKVKKMYQTYNQYMHSKEGSNVQNTYTGNPNMNFGENASMMDMMKSVLTPEQASTVEAMSMLLNNMS